MSQNKMREDCSTRSPGGLARRGRMLSVSRWLEDTQSFRLHTNHTSVFPDCFSAIQRNLQVASLTGITTWMFWALRALHIRDCPLKGSSRVINSAAVCSSQQKVQPSQTADMWQQHQTSQCILNRVQICLKWKTRQTEMQN